MDQNKRLPGVIELAKESVAVYRQEWRPLLKIVLLSYVIFIAVTIAGIAICLLMANGFPNLGQNNLAWIAMGLLAFIYFATIFFLSSWFNAATIIVLRDWPKIIGLRESLALAKPYIYPYCWTILIASILVFTGFAFFIIPGIVFSIWFLLSRYVIFIGSERGMAALLKSMEYGRGYFWNIFLLSLLFSVFFLFIGSMLQSLDQLPFGNVIRIAANAAISPLATIYSYLMFDHLRKIKGDSLPAPSAVKKNIFAGVGVIGALAAIIAICLVVLFFPQIKEKFNAEIGNIETQQNGRLSVPFLKN